MRYLCYFVTGPYCAATLRFRFFTTKNISRRRFTAVLAVLIQTGLYNLYTFFEFSNPNSLFFFYDILKSLDYRNYNFRTSFIDNKNLFTCKHNKTQCQNPVMNVKLKITRFCNWLQSLRLYFWLEVFRLSLIHISEPTRRTPISYAVFC